MICNDTNTVILIHASNMESKFSYLKFDSSNSNAKSQEVIDGERVIKSILDPVSHQKGCSTYKSFVVLYNHPSDPNIPGRVAKALETCYGARNLQWKRTQGDKIVLKMISTS